MGWSEDERIFKDQIKLYADGRKICNCGQAYYNDKGHCEWGCSTNVIVAKHELVRKLVQYLEAAKKN